MLGAVGTTNVNPIKLFNAVNAFKTVTNLSKAQEIQMPETSSGININDKSILDNQNLDEIKNFAQIAGEENLTNEDIQYGLTYGRSVIADYIA